MNLKLIFQLFFLQIYLGNPLEFLIYNLLCNIISFLSRGACLKILIKA